MINRDAQRGHSMIEFILCLPFIWIIMVLAVDFADGLLAKQRAVVAVREAGLSHTFLLSQAPEGAASGTDVQRILIESRINQDFLRERRVNGTLGVYSQDSDDWSDFQSTAPIATSIPLGDVLGSLSSTQGYSLSAAYTPPVATLLPGGTIKTTFVVDGSPWTYHERPDGYLGILKDAFMGLGKLFGGSF